MRICSSGPIFLLMLSMFGLSCHFSAANAQLRLVSLESNSSNQANPIAETIPKPFFQGDFFGEMPRVFCTITQVDTQARVLTVKVDGSGKIVRVPIKDDTELHFRDSWGELTDYFPGQHVMLFLYIDDDKNWTYPRAVQDDIHMTARHNWFARITKIDRSLHTYHTSREEKNGTSVKIIEKDVFFAPDSKIWKGEHAQGVEALQEGDEVIQQLVERDGKLVAVEIFDRKGDDAVRAVQDARHRKDQEQLGLPAYVSDVEPVSGSLVVTVAWSGADRARELKPRALLTLTPTDGSKPFAAALSAMQPIDTRQRIQFVVNARVASRLASGQSLRLFLPGTGPALPTGRAGVPRDKP